jgi:hypothetical protein
MRVCDILSISRSLSVVAGSLLLLSACGGGSAASSPNGFGMSPSSQVGNAAGNTLPIVSGVVLSFATVTGGDTVTVTVELERPAPTAGVTVQLASSDPSAIKLPATLHVAAGQSSATVQASTAATGVPSSVAITASIGNSRAGVNVKLVNVELVNVKLASRITASPTLPVQPDRDTVAPAESGISEASTDPDATFKGCWYKTKKNHYQAVDISAGIPGTYAFNAVLYSGTTCNPADWADQFGFGQLITFGDFGYTFWFTDFKNKTNMSAIWYLGDENSGCVNYSKAPAC